MIECSFDKRAFFSEKVWSWQNGSLNFRKKFQKLFLRTANMPSKERSQNNFVNVPRFFAQSLKNKKEFF